VFPVSVVSDDHPVLSAAGVGGFWGGLIACTFLGWWGVVLALVLLFGTAIAATVIDARRKRRN
jgi:hypothetical protein